MPGLVFHFLPATFLGKRKYLHCVAHTYLIKVQSLKTMPCFFIPLTEETKQWQWYGTAWGWMWEGRSLENTSSRVHGLTNFSPFSLWWLVKRRCFLLNFGQWLAEKQWKKSRGGSPGDGRWTASSGVVLAQWWQLPCWQRQDVPTTALDHSAFPKQKFFYWNNTKPSKDATYKAQFNQTKPKCCLIFQEIWIDCNNLSLSRGFALLNF